MDDCAPEVAGPESHLPKKDFHDRQLQVIAALAAARKKKEAAAVKASERQRTIAKSLKHKILRQFCCDEGETRPETTSLAQKSTKKCVGDAFGDWKRRQRVPEGSRVFGTWI
jgi:hypothetical protein